MSYLIYIGLGQSPLSIDRNEDRMKNTQHTPTPYYATKQGRGIHIQSAKINEDNYVCEVYGTLNDKANAEHIVKCVNSHDALVEALKMLVVHIEKLSEDGNIPNITVGTLEAYRQAKQAAKLAEGK